MFKQVLNVFKEVIFGNYKYTYRATTTKILNRDHENKNIKLA